MGKRLLPRKREWGVARKYAYANTCAQHWPHVSSLNINVLSYSETAGSMTDQARAPGDEGQAASQGCGVGLSGDGDGGAQSHVQRRERCLSWGATPDAGRGGLGSQAQERELGRACFCLGSTQLAITSRLSVCGKGI